MAHLPVMTVIRKDITTVTADAIVNAANSSLMGGGGVDGAIHRAGGSQIIKECKIIIARQGGCKTGEAVITSGGNLPAKFVIHTVGPVWKGGFNGETEQLASCYRNSLRLALEHQCHSIAFPNISTGIYGFPKAKAASIAISTIDFFLQNEPVIQEVFFVCFDQENFELMQAEIARINQD